MTCLAEERYWLENPLDKASDPKKIAATRKFFMEVYNKHRKKKLEKVLEKVAPQVKGQSKV